MDEVERKTIYFKYCGEANTERVLLAVRRRCKEAKIDKVVIASETGRSALKALKIFDGAKIQIVVVTHYPARLGDRREAYP